MCVPLEDTALGEAIIRLRSEPSFMWRSSLHLSHCFVDSATSDMHDAALEVYRTQHASTQRSLTPALLQRQPSLWLYLGSAFSGVLRTQDCCASKNRNARKHAAQRQGSDGETQNPRKSLPIHSSPRALLALLQVTQEPRSDAAPRRSLAMLARC